MNVNTISPTTKAALLSLATIAACTEVYVEPITDRQVDRDSGGDGGAQATDDGGGNTPDSTSTSTGDGGDGGGTQARGTVYAVTFDRDLYAFEPATLVFNKIGALDCPEPRGDGLYPTGLAFDRSGTGWLLFDDGNLYNIDVTSAHCSMAPSAVGAALAKPSYGLAFVPDGQGSVGETLYVSTSNGIDAIDLSSSERRTIGTFGTGPSWLSALAGTSDGRLYGLLLPGQGPWVLSEIDTSSARILSSAPLPDAIEKGYAVASWGGDLWTFGWDGVDRYQPSIHTTTNVLPKPSFLVMAAAARP